MGDVLEVLLSFCCRAMCAIYRVRPYSNREHIQLFFRCVTWHSILYATVHVWVFENFYHRIRFSIFYQRNNSLCDNAFWHNYIFIHILFIILSFYLYFFLSRSFWNAFKPRLQLNMLNGCERNVLKLNCMQFADNVISVKINFQKRKSFCVLFSQLLLLLHVVFFH